MAFNMKTWVDRITEYPTRRRLRKEDGSDELVTVTREEGQVSEEGDAFSAENMNDLESRIDTAFKDVNNSLAFITKSFTGQNTNVPANAYASIDIPISIEEGYIPIAILSFSGGNTLIDMESIEFGSNYSTLYIRVSNATSVGKNVIPIVNVLFAKSTIVDRQ